MGSKIREDEISSIIKERIDNFELNIDKEEIPETRHSGIELNNIDTGKLSSFRKDSGILVDNNSVKFFKHPIDTVCDDILSLAEKDSLYFICKKCKCVGDTDYLNIEILKPMLEPEVVTDTGLLCKECYEGKESDGIKPTEDEMYIASFSNYDFISKFDHVVPEIIVEDPEQPHGVKLGTIKSLDDVNIKESSTLVSEQLKGYLKELQNDLDKRHPGMKIKSKKIDNMLEFPNRTMLVLELADFKRKLKLAKKSNNKDDIKYYQDLMKKTKEKIDITHD